MAASVALAEENENPFHLSHWLGQVDPRPLALFRIGFGLLLLHDLFDYARDLPAFLTDSGIAPRALLNSAQWSVFRLSGAPGPIMVLFALTVVVTVAFTLGLFTRAATVATWVMVTSLHQRNPFVIDGGDALARIFLFWSMFTDLAGCWSLDSLMSRKSGPVRAIGARLLRYHLAALYAVTAWQKFCHGRGESDWIQGDAIFKALQLRGFVRPLGEMLAAHPSLCALLTHLVFFLEASFALFALSPVAIKWARAGAILADVGVQLGILFTMRVGIFTELTLWAGVLYLQPEWLDALERGLRSGRAAATSSAAWAVRRLPRASATEAGFAILLWGQFALVDLSWVRRLPQPQIAERERLFLGLEQPWDLFGKTNSIIEWKAPGVREDGSPVEVLAIAAPGLLAKVGTRFSRWYIFEEPDRHVHYEPLALFLCEAFAAQEIGRSRLHSFKLVRQVQLPRGRGERESPLIHETLWEQACPRR